MTQKTINILIVGAGKLGQAFIEALSKNGMFNIIGIVDADTKATGIVLAKKMGIPTGRNWAKFINDRSLDEIIDITDSPEV
ncbi:MAG: Gfo/Idh/MocA family oxidoreductase, partial [Candidatus Omnitrophica bacterium]|nr:Gfo/Idh/MocA family oxidoreductase [Candidatus Omnitrophota bacterium]